MHLLAKVNVKHNNIRILTVIQHIYVKLGYGGYYKRDSQSKFNISYIYAVVAIHK